MTGAIWGIFPALPPVPHFVPVLGLVRRPESQAPKGPRIENEGCHFCRMRSQAAGYYVRCASHREELNARRKAAYVSRAARP